ncbi:uncharacterized protein J3R85_003743 [Psidium guajava]|nr:uncharacterized protein J3R85_003743 [Psidium guajava]
MPRPLSRLTARWLESAAACLAVDSFSFAFSYSTPVAHSFRGHFPSLHRKPIEGSITFAYPHRRRRHCSDPPRANLTSHPNRETLP